MPVNHQALADEYRLDPRGYGYAADLAIGYDGELMARGNVVRDGTNPPTNPAAAGGRADGAIFINRGFITPDQLASAIVYAEYTGGQAAPRQYIDMLMSLPRIDLNPNSNPRLALETIFAPGSTTRTNIVNIAREFGSRNRELFGQNITLDDVSSARALIPST